MNLAFSIPFPSILSWAIVVTIVWFAVGYVFSRLVLRPLGERIRKRSNEFYRRAREVNYASWAVRSFDVADAKRLERWHGKLHTISQWSFGPVSWFFIAWNKIDYIKASRRIAKENRDA